MLRSSTILTRSQSTISTVTTPKFALAPDRSNTDVLDLASKIDIVTFHSDSAPLTVRFDSNSNDTGWIFMTGDIFTIKDKKKKNKDLITEYGRLTEDEIKKSLIYLNSEPRQTQNNQMMVECILASLTEAYFYKISNE